MNRSKVLNEFLLLAKHQKLPSKKKILDAAKRALFVLDTEESSYRERIPGTDVTGGLLDFRALDERDGANGANGADGASSVLATIIVPDIHARPEFIYNILNCDLSKIAPFFAELSESPLTRLKKTRSASFAWATFFTPKEGRASVGPLPIALLRAAFMIRLRCARKWRKAWPRFWPS